MKRRDFLKFGTAGLAVVAVGGMSDWPRVWGGSRTVAASVGLGHLALDMVDADAEMVDGIRVPMWAFKLTGGNHGSLEGARIPGPVLVALEGDRIELHLTNRITTGGAHGFAIPGVSLTVGDNTVAQVTVPQGGEVAIEFIAPAAGTYMYLDPLNAPVNRTMGLHGALVVLPNPVANNTPYSGLSDSHSIRRLFNDLGTAAHFPGAPWDPNRNAIWVFNTIDPVKAAAATAGPNAISPAAFLGGFLPQYFTINGKSGFFSAQHGHVADSGGGSNHNHGLGENLLSVSDGLFDAQGNVSISGRVGQPILIRNLNPGLMWQSPHIHGNHVYVLAHGQINQDHSQLSRVIPTNLHMVDTWTMEPGSVQDVLLPFIAPPDIPDNFWQAAAAGTNHELFPLVYPMHDHNEISNSAAGGNYPQGAATHWQIDGPFDPTDPALGVIQIERAELRIRTGQLLLEGRFTVPNVVLDIHAGGSSGPPITRSVQVGADGRFRFRGRALKAVTSRFVTMMHHDPVTPSLVHASRTVPLRLI
jgi:hypothetical protein